MQARVALAHALSKTCKLCKRTRSEFHTRLGVKLQAAILLYAVPLLSAADVVWNQEAKTN